LIAEIKKLGDLPTIVTGDFNVSPEASAYTTMIGAGFLDSSHVAKEGEIKSTYNGMDDSYTGAIIDYIFVSPDLGGAVDTYTVCPAKRDGQWISDHNAIIATITLPKPEAE
jgi:endonuclease/exonuclease/phosphatase family metal-dependent hydrolase